MGGEVVRKKQSEGERRWELGKTEGRVDGGGGGGGKRWWQHFSSSAGCKTCYC